MKIVVVGAGEVGTHITSHLSQEGHDIILIDSDAERLQRAENELDALTFQGNGASLKVLELAGAANADMIIAVTNIDEINIVACVTGRILGIKRRIARVKDNDYFLERSGRSMQRVGVDLMINPDLEAAIDIERLVSLPGATDVTDFGEARARMVGLYVAEKSEVVGVPLRELDRKFGPLPVTIVAIIRNDKTLIPMGDTALEPGDHVFVIGESWLMPDVMGLIGEDLAPVRNVMIVGAGPVSRHLARYLVDHKIQVKLVEVNKEKARWAAGELDKVMVLHGDGTDVELLGAENVGEMDAFIAASNDEETNIMSCLLARHLGAKKTISLIRRSNYVPLVHVVGIDAAVSVRLSTATAVMKHFRRGEILSFAQLKETDAEALEFLAQDGCRALKRPLQKLGLPKNAVVGAIIRGTQVIVPRGDTQIKEGDRVVVFALHDAIEQVEKVFCN
ncbi:MAG: Trk system potassium transporter TrkA [Candidatus Eisenbacteria bacterium]|uniref:Trk system potassium uptake protein TrkA n=1 Tax=Eiseniibacteriota bacterium TaxID=2212470 RepID=A0A956NBH4_UNCEI|nr:Trk system potassium transporter TrkA [Candidatus Eisenbacteria bacterium]MCB9463207.1 Trk system potassium transporter TrkA [Candidatus Eisenbacteria bacterium]